MDWQKKSKEFFFNYIAIYTPTRIFHLLTITILTLLLPLSFLLLASLSGAKFYLQIHSQQPLPYLFSFAIHTSPCILYVLVSIVSVATLINGLMGKINLMNDSSNSILLQTRLYMSWKWILLFTFQICVGLGIEASIAAGVFDSDNDVFDDGSSSFGVERSFISRMIFLLGLHETTQIWSRVVVRPVVDDTIFGVGKTERLWIEKVVVAGSLGTLWWWKLREEVENLGVMAETKKDEMMEVGIEEFVGWWLYYLTVTIGMVRIVKGLMWIFMISLCRRRVTQINEVELELSQNDDKV
ncbi:hypothetical protein MtrunA17_Chr1g0194611 [Medicago truncatula]|uniref:Transmembrane protein, putative n=1 Tax=Medicago truncatula TaxID=3880 RepID=G7ICX3_MEDTR|nr:uncharacterized protein LOC11414884 [Medicago truncatula]AES61644.1 transmembrane protein, putative [Medicago truncatula]AFK37501.1 unknown [Medicago truncatula]RHN81026.1 hypothetical protein MtrunA17_Chr1g0194611 [Medicago truncatula]